MGRSMALKVTDKNKKTLILAGLGVVLVVVVCVRLFSGGGAGDSASASPFPGILEPTPASELDSDPKHLETVAKVAKARSGEAYSGDQLRDPMVPLVGTRPSRDGDEEDQPEQAAPVALPPMSLYGIVWDPANPVALIDGSDVHVGETVKGARVVAINVDSVVFAYRSRQFVLAVE
jgi:hypothetical protein